MTHPLNCDQILALNIEVCLFEISFTFLFHIIHHWNRCPFPAFPPANAQLSLHCQELSIWDTNVVEFTLLMDFTSYQSLVFPGSSPFCSDRCAIMRLTVSWNTHGSRILLTNRNEFGDRRFSRWLLMECVATVRLQHTSPERCIQDCFLGGGGQSWKKLRTLFFHF